jgi:hypothetical protein
MLLAYRYDMETPSEALLVLIEALDNSRAIFQTNRLRINPSAKSRPTVCLLW